MPTDPDELPLINIEDLDPSQVFDPMRESYFCGDTDPAEDESMDAVSVEDYEFLDDSEESEEALEPDDGDEDNDGDFEFDTEDD